MSAIDNARAALAQSDRVWANTSRQDRNVSALGEAMRDLIAEHERLTAETETERAVRMVDDISRTTGMTREQVVSTVNSIGRPPITAKMLDDAARAIHNLVESGTSWESTKAHQRNLRREEAGAALNAALTIHTNGGER